MSLSESIIKLSAATGLQFFFSPTAKSSLTTLTFHKFSQSGEPKAKTRDRLKTYCDWMNQHFHPLQSDIAIQGLINNKLPEHPLIVTIDDASADILDIIDIFIDMEIPVTEYVCTGWTEKESALNENTILHRLADYLYWYHAESVQVSFKNKHDFQLDRTQRNINVDLLLELTQQYSNAELMDFWEVLSKLPDNRATSRICNWQELNDLKKAGVTIGSHTCTHTLLAKHTESRMKFEILESKKIIKDKLGDCQSFAYPFGSPDSWNSATTTLLHEAGYQYAFLTRENRAQQKTNVMQLPRIGIPDAANFETFKMRTEGAAIPLLALRSLMQ